MFVICPKCGVKYQIPADITLKSGQKMQCSACEHYFVFTPLTTCEERKITKSKNESVLSEKIKENQPVLLSQDTPVIEKKEVSLPEVFLPSTVLPKKTSLFLPILIVILSFLILLVLVGLVWQYRLELRDQNMLRNIQLNRSLIEKEPRQSLPVKVPNVISESPVSIPVFQNSDEAKEFIPEREGNLEDQPSIDLLSFRSVRFQLILNGDHEDVQIEGLIRNDSTQILTLPANILATAYDFQGNALFKKEIYLSKQILYPEEELPFFGTYTPAPKEIKWIDVSYQK